MSAGAKLLLWNLVASCRYGVVLYAGPNHTLSTLISSSFKTLRLNTCISVITGFIQTEHLYLYRFFYVYQKTHWIPQCTCNAQQCGMVKTPWQMLSLAWPPIASGTIWPFSTHYPPPTMPTFTRLSQAELLKMPTVFLVPELTCWYIYASLIFLHTSMQYCKYYTQS